MFEDGHASHFDMNEPHVQKQYTGVLTEVYRGGCTEFGIKTYSTSNPIGYGPELLMIDCCLPTPVDELISY